ncbi:MAG: preprotein translocase subunit YajC [Bacillota bacterium]
MELVLSILPWLLIFGVFWFFLIRPQKKKQKEHQELLNKLQSGDKVVTAGGIKGEIKKIKDNVITLEVSPNAKLEILRSSISRLDNQQT